MVDDRLIAKLGRTLNRGNLKYFKNNLKIWLELGNTEE
jgi:hypothetical protein